MFLRINFISLLTILFIASSNAQDTEPFERLYRAQGTSNITTSLDARGSGSITLSLQINQQDESKAVTVASFDEKGKVNWAAEYTFMDTLDILATGDIKSLESGFILFSVLLDKDSVNKVVTLVDGDSGGVVWSKITGQNDELGRADEAPSILAEVMPNMLVHTHRVIDPESIDPILLTALNLDGTDRFEHRLSFPNGADAHVEDLIVDIDSTLYILGSTDQSDAPIFLSKLDTLGNVLWNRTYDLVVDEAEDMQGLHITQLTDTSLVIVGGFQAGAARSRSIFVIQADREGNAERIERMNVDVPGEVFPVGLTTLESSIVIAAKNLRSDDVITTLVNYNLDSTFQYQAIMDTTTSELIYRGGLVSGDSILATFASSSFYPEFDNIAPYLVTVSPIGQTMCNENVPQFSIDSIGIIEDTFEWTIDTSMVVDSIEVIARTFSFDEPRFTLQDTTYCPNDEISFLLDATTRGATQYVWTDDQGSILGTDSTFLATEEGMFIANVIVGIEECFSLCDTANIQRSEPPMVSIDANNQFCERGEFVLTSQEMVSGSIVSRDWSTGETTPEIVVSEPGTYSVLIIDQCGDPANGEVTLSQNDFSGNTTLATNVSGLNCDDLTIILGVGAVPDLSLLSWSTGESGVSSITITSPGSYTATYNDQFCPGSVTFEITEDQFNTTPTLEVMADCVTTAGDTSFQLSFTTTGMNPQWEDGSTNNPRRITTSGNYSINVTGACGDLFTEVIEVSPDQIADCINLPSCLDFPNVFIPRDREEENRTFGPREICPVENYELKIYNRWGQNIWTTNTVDERWDGTKDGDQVPGGVYFWWASETVEGLENISEGDVTLIR